LGLLICCFFSATKIFDTVLGALLYIYHSCHGFFSKEFSVTRFPRGYTPTHNTPCRCTHHYNSRVKFEAGLISLLGNLTFEIRLAERGDGDLILRLAYTRQRGRNIGNDKGTFLHTYEEQTNGYIKVIQIMKMLKKTGNSKANY
jgi:hypothetical protein